MSSLSRLYDVRHVITHEIPHRPVFDIEEVPVLAAAAESFIAGTDWVVVEALHGAVPRTQAAMTESVGNALGAEEARLDEIISEVVALKGIDEAELSALQHSWGKWADAQATLVASQLEGGSMFSMVWSSEMIALTIERREQLIRLKREWLDS